MTMTAQETADSLAEMTGAFERRRDAIRAALLAERKAALAGVRVKPLEWVKHPEAEMWRCDSVVGDYRLSAVTTPSWSFNDNRGGFFHRDAVSTEAAKAAAQADYESRIRSALALSPEGKGPTDHTPEEET